VVDKNKHKKMTGRPNTGSLREEGGAKGASRSLRAYVLDIIYYITY
jgi:hypothetical protein